MFKKLMESWKRAGQEAEGAYLKKQLTIIYTKIDESRQAGYPLDGHVMFSFADLHADAIRQFGSISKVQKDAISELIAKGNELNKASTSYDHSIGERVEMRGRGFGAQLFAIFLQSHFAVGEDAALVKKTLTDFLEEALEERRRMNEFFASDPGWNP